MSGTYEICGGSAAHDPSADVSTLCDVCGQDCAYCQCPECPVCRETGKASCYAEHGLNGAQTMERLYRRMEALGAQMRQINAEMEQIRGIGLVMLGVKTDVVIKARPDRELYVRFAKFGFEEYEGTVYPQAMIKGSPLTKSGRPNERSMHLAGWVSRTDWKFVDPALVPATAVEADVPAPL